MILIEPTKDEYYLKKGKRIKTIKLTNHFDDVNLKIILDQSNDMEVIVSPLKKKESKTIEENVEITEL